MRDIVAAIILLLLAPIGFFHPYLGLLAWTWVSYMTPALYAWSWATKIPQGVVIAVPTIIGLVFTHKRQAVPFTRETLLLVLLLFWFTLSTIHVWQSPEFAYHLPRSLAAFTDVLKTFLMIFVALMLITDRKKLRWWLLLTAGTLGLLAAKGAIQGLLAGGEVRIYGPPHSMITDNNDFALAMNMCLPMFVYLAQNETSRRIRLFLRLGFVFGVISIVLTYSRGGLVGLAAVLLVLLFQGRHKLRSLVGVALLLIVIFAAAPGKWIERMQTIPTAAQTDQSAQARLVSWRLGTLLALDHPFFGGGFDAYTPQLYQRYGIPTGYIAHSSHSIYFEALADHGFVGLSLFLALLFSCLWTCWRVKRRALRYPSLAHWRPYCDMVIASILAYAAGGAFLGRAYLVLYYQLVTATIIISAAARQELRQLHEERIEASFAHAEDIPAGTPEQAGWIG
jgi:probable O-glycosylation ligase (exosortase A-associated)